MKILHIIDSGGLYGAEMVLLNLVAEQMKLGVEPTIASIGEKHIAEKPLEAEAIKRGFTVRKFRMVPGPNIAGALEILKCAHKGNFDLLHSHGYKGNVLFGFMPKKFRKLPLVSTLHGWTSTDGFSKNRVYEMFDALSLRFIDAVVVVNKSMLNHPVLRKRLSIKYHVVNNGIPVVDESAPSHLPAFLSSKSETHAPTFRPSATLDKTIVEFCQGGWTIGSIGRLSREKGYRHLVEAVGFLVKEGVDARLVIIGEGYERGYLERLGDQWRLLERILLPGYQDDAKKYLPFFHVFAISSLTEGLPITLLEAMQAKVPIVATMVGGVPEVLHNGKAGLLVAPSIPSALGEAIMQIYKNSSLADELVGKAYHRLSTEYSSRGMALGYHRIYNELVE